MNLLSKIFQKYLVRLEYLNPSFAQEGEDLILQDLFDHRKTGFYVDVGAHHPMRFSNTYLFYNRGWSGINIDPLINESNLFHRRRPRDINLGVGISNIESEVEFYFFNDPALNTFSEERKNYLLRSTPYKLTGSKKVKTFPLRKILEKHLPKSQKIDFMTIDAEGLDDLVIESNDWDLYKPDVVLVEENSQSSSDKTRHNKRDFFFAEKGYKFVAKTNRTLFYQLRKDNA